MNILYTPFLKSTYWFFEKHPSKLVYFLRIQIKEFFVSLANIKPHFRGVLCLWTQGDLNWGQAPFQRNAKKQFLKKGRVDIFYF